jgi:hypothetical protein
MQAGTHQPTRDKGVIFHELAGCFFAFGFEDHDRRSNPILAAPRKQDDPFPSCFL